MKRSFNARRLGVLAAVVALGAATFVAFGNAAAEVKPANTALPTISDTTPESGQALIASAGTWTGDQPIVFKYEWLRCNATGGGCVKIPRANGQQYTAQTADVGNALRVRVTAKNSSGSTQATSGATSAVAPAPPAPAPGSTIPVTAVAPPARLVAAQVQFSPNPITRSTTAIDVRVRVQDTRGFFVSGALVFVRPTPLVTTGAEVATGADGWATVTLHPRKNFGIVRLQDNLQIFVRARKPGEPLFAGVSGRRLVQLKIAH
jgi:hypothetical protein